MTITYTLEELPSVAKQLIENAPYKIVAFDADMGVGKTTLIKELCKQLGVTEVISSPTYSIVNEYSTKDNFIYHFDFYRIKTEEEAYDIGFEEYLDRDTWVFIEWSEKVSNLLPDHISRIHIEILEDHKRALSIIDK